MVIMSQYKCISNHHVYTLNSHNVICQLYLNKAEGKKMQTNVFNTKHNMISKTCDSRFLCGSGLKGWAEFPLGCMGERHRCLHSLKVAKCLRKDKPLNEKQH